MKQIIVKGKEIEFVKEFNSVEEAQDFINNHKELGLTVNDIYDNGYNKNGDKIE